MNEMFKCIERMNFICRMYDISTPRKNFLRFKQNFFESNKFVHCYMAKEKFL